jgi:glycosyltransferase involved in cell wall biosynthesis
MIKILIVTNELLYTCGISKQIKYFLQGLKNQKEFEFSIFCGGGEAVDDYRNLCKEVFIDERIKHENRSYLNYIISFMKIFRLAIKNQYNIIHSHNHYAANICSKVSYFTGIVDVQTNHGILPEIGSLNHFSGSYIICVNEHIRDYVIQNNFNWNEKIKLFPNGIRSIESPAKSSYGKLKIISASRLIPEKGHDTFIKAIALLPRSVKEKAEFLIAGKGSFEQQLKKLNTELKAGINFIGEVKNLLEIFKTTHIFILATISDSEGLPLTLIEAALTKNLIISSRYYGINPIFYETLESFIFEKGNAHALADKIQYAIENYEKSQNIIATLYEKVSKEYSLDKMTKNLTDFYKSII